MKKLLTLLVALVMVSCVDDADHFKKPELSNIQKISKFYEETRSLKLSNEEIGIRLNEFMLSLGAKNMGEAEVPIAANGSGRVASCDGASVRYEFADESIYVRPFEGQCGPCNSGGHAVTVMQWDGQHYHVSTEFFCN